MKKNFTRAEIKNLENLDLNQRLRVEMSIIRNRIRKGIASSGNLSQNERALRRHAHDKAREYKRREQKKFGKIKYSHQFSIEELVKRFQVSPILDALYPERQKKWQLMIKRKPKFGKIDLKNFNFHDDPNQTLRQLKDIAKLEATAKALEVNFPDEYITDIGSFLVLNDIWPVVGNMARRGRMMPPVQRVLKLMQIGDSMNIEFNGVKDGDEIRDVWAMPVKKKAPIKGGVRESERFLPPQRADKVIDQFKQTVNNWLAERSPPMQLTPEGAGELKNIYGELLDNAERHSDENRREGNWRMGAFMARRIVDGEAYYVCCVAVLSVGQSIAESFRQAPDKINDYAESYAKKHKNKHQSISTLKTLVALQDCVSTDPESQERGEGGMGLQHAFELFKEIGLKVEGFEPPRMTILSGKSCIHLRDPYIAGTRKTDSSKKLIRLPPRELWFNEENAPKKPPNKDFVYDLDEHFQGTLVTMTFAMEMNEKGAQNDPDY